MVKTFSTAQVLALSCLFSFSLQLSLPVSVQTLLQLTAARATTQQKPTSNATENKQNESKTEESQPRQAEKQPTQPVTVSSKEEATVPETQPKQQTAETIPKTDTETQIYISRLHSSVTRQQLRRLFDIAPGFKTYQLKRHHDKRGKLKAYAYVTYKSTEQAEYALEKFDGLEYPQGHPLDVQLASQHLEKKAKRKHGEIEDNAEQEEVTAMTEDDASVTSEGISKRQEEQDAPSPKRVKKAQLTIAPATTTCTTPEPTKSKSTNEQASSKLTKEASQVKKEDKGVDDEKQATSSSKEVSAQKSEKEGTKASKTSSTKSSKTTSDSTSAMAKEDEDPSRLFFVFKPLSPPLATIQSVFSRFGPLRELWQVHNSNHGYAWYRNEPDAARALQLLDDTYVMGSSLRVLVAKAKTEQQKVLSEAKRNRHA